MLYLGPTLLMVNITMATTKSMPISKGGGTLNTGYKKPYNYTVELETETSGTGAGVDST